VGGSKDGAPKVDELRKAGLDGIPIHNNYLVVCMFLPSDIMTLEQVITDCGNDPSKKTTLDELLRLALTAGVAKGKNTLEQRQEVHGHVKIICRAMYPVPNYSQIFELGTSAKSCIFHVDKASHFGKCVHEGGANGGNPLGKESVRVSISMVSQQF